MKDKVSELMDGELNKHDAKKIIAAIKDENALQNEWEIYHLIGDSLRQSSNLTTNITRRVSEQLVSEPALFVPEYVINHPNQSSQPIASIKPESYKIKVFAFATAASLIAMISTWLVMQNVYQQPHPVVVAEQSRIQSGTDQSHVPIRVLHSSTTNQYPYIPNGDMTNYLYFHNFHNELSPGSSISKQPVYIYPVTDFQDSYGR